MDIATVRTGMCVHDKRDKIQSKSCEHIQDDIITHNETMCTEETSVSSSRQLSVAGWVVCDAKCVELEKI